MSQFIIYTFAENSQYLTNHGSDGATYNAQANSNKYHIYAPSGYPYWGPYAGAGDIIVVPAGTNNSYPALRTHAWEFGFNYGNHGSNATYEKFYDKACGGFYIGTQMISGHPHLVVYAATTGNPVYWTSSSVYFTPGHFYYVMVCIALPTSPSSTVASNCHVHIGGDLNSPGHVDLTFGGAGSGSWFNDSGGAGSLSNYNCGGGYNAQNSWFIYREFNNTVQWDTTSDWATDVLRWSPNQSTSISCAASNYYPVIGTTWQVTGTLQTTGGTHLANRPLTVHWSHDQGATWNQTANGWANTDANGNYSFDQTAEAYTSIWVEYLGETGYTGSSSNTINVYGQSVNATAYPPVITSDFQVIAPSYGDSVYAGCVGMETAPVAPILGLGITPSVVSFECAPGTVYPDILGQFTFAFPPRIQIDAEARSMLVSLLSTEIHPSVLEPELGPQNYCFVQVSEDAPAPTAGTECGVIDPVVKIDYPEILEVDAILEEILECDAELEDTVHMKLTVEENIELELEVTTE